MMITHRYGRPAGRRQIRSPDRFAAPAPEPYRLACPLCGKPEIAEKPTRGARRGASYICTLGDTPISLRILYHAGADPLPTCGERRLRLSPQNGCAPATGRRQVWRSPPVAAPSEQKIAEPASSRSARPLGQSRPG